MRAELAEEQLARGEVEHEQARLGRGQRVVDDREHVFSRDQSHARGAMDGLERELERFRVQAGCLLEKRGVQSSGLCRVGGRDYGNE